MTHTDRSHERPRRRTVILLAAVAVVAAAAACSSGGDQRAASTTSSTLLLLPGDDRPTPVRAPEGFVVPDTRTAVLLPVKGRRAAEPPLPIFGGSSTLRGKVTGPDGPVAGATVRVQRVVGDRVASTEVTTADDGGFTVTQLLGGHYRVRAWLQPSLAATEAEVVFLAANQASVDVEIRLSRFDGRQLLATLDSGEPRVGEPATLRALYTQQSVNAEGIVTGQGIAGAPARVELDGGFRLDGEPTATTGRDGIASWRVVCAREGRHQVTVSTPELTTRVTLPACVARTPTTTAPGPVDVPDLPVGEEFSVPHPGVVPAGTYRTFLDGCATSFQVYADGRWQEERRVVTGSTIELATPARDFRPANGTGGCRYRRVA